MKEIFKDIPNYEGLYQVSNLGNLKSLNYNGTNKPKLMSNKCVNSQGYCIAAIFKDKQKKQYGIHQLVAIAFLNHNTSDRNIVVNHINFNKTDNRVENLEIVTARENSNLKHKKSTSKYVGVSWDSYSKKWRSRIRVNGFDESLGLYDCQLKASEAYQKRLKEL